MRRRNTAALFLVALALFAYYALMEHSKTSPPVHAGLVALDPDAVERVTIRRGTETIELARVDTHWEINQPVRDLAATPAVMRLLAALARLSIEGDIGIQEDLEPFGLDTPIRIVAVTADRESVAVDIGGYTVDRSFCYALPEKGGAVLLVPTALRRYAQAPVEDFRYQRVATFDISLVDSLRVAAHVQETSWHRDRGGWFTTVEGDTIVGNTTAVEGILRRVRGLRVIGFPEREVQFVGEHLPTLTVYRTPPNPPQRFRVAPEQSSFVVEIQPEDRQVLVDSSAIELFGYGVEQLRERRLLRFNPEDVARIELETESTTATFLRSRSGWTVPNPALGDLNADLVGAALRAAGALEFDRVLRERQARQPDIDGATFRLALFDSGGTIIDELVCRLEHDDAVAAATSRSSRLYVEMAASKLHRLEERFQRIQTH